MSRIIARNKDTPLAEIARGARLRPVSEAGVAALMASVEALGGFTDAIRVRREKSGFTLLSGGHRLEAARRLGHETIRADVIECNADEAALYEIDENLARAELSLLYKCVFLAARKRAYLSLHPETARGGDQTAMDGSLVESFATSIARMLRVGERHAFKMIAIGERLSKPTVDALSAHPVDFKTLAALARLEGREQVRAAEMMVEAGLPLDAALAAMRGAVSPPAPDPAEAAFARLDAGFSRAPRTAQRRFLTRLVENDETRRLMLDALEGAPL